MIAKATVTDALERHGTLINQRDKMEYHVTKKRKLKAKLEIEMAKIMK